MNLASMQAKSPLSYFFVHGKSEILFGSKLKSFIGIYWLFKIEIKVFWFRRIFGQGYLFQEQRKVGILI